jgi:hypothetical protein
MSHVVEETRHGYRCSDDRLAKATARIDGNPDRPGSDCDIALTIHADVRRSVTITCRAQDVALVAETLSAAARRFRL